MEKNKESKLQNIFQSEAWHNYKKSSTAIIGTFLLVVVILVAIFGPLFTVQNPYDIADLSLNDAYLAPAWEDGGSSQFLLGTDQQGRDMLSAMIYGSRVSIFIGITGVLLAASFGIFMGLVSGYFGGKIDMLIMRAADVQLSFPSLLIALFLMTIFGRGVVNILIALLLVGWVRYARIVRGAVLSVKQSEYIEAAKIIGLPDYKIIIKHVLPNVATSVIVLSTIQVGNFILTEATLSFLGLGVPETQPSLGMLCSNGFNVLYS